MADTPSALKVGINVDLGDVISELKKTGIKFKENRTYDKQVYSELLEKYAEALTVIDKLQDELTAARQSKMPSAEEIENMGNVLNMVDLLNDKVPQLLQLQKTINTFNAGTNDD